MSDSIEPASPVDQPCAPPDLNPRKPSIAVPPGACDCHAHIFGDPRRYPYKTVRRYTPSAIIKKLHADFAAALNSADVKALLATDGSEVVASSPEYFGKVIRAEFARWAPVVKESGAKID